MHVTNIKKSTLFLLTPILLVAVLVLVLFLAGWRTFVVVSPSMGQTAPVGSLVITKKTHDYQPNDIITFTQHNRVYTHRVQSKDGDTLITKGDLNGSIDPWRIASADVLGEAVSITRHLGWLLRALPWLLLGMIIVYILSLFIRENSGWRWPARIIGGSLVVTIISLWLHPWINFGLLSYLPADGGGIKMHIINTGIFPIRAEDTHLRPGEDAVITIRHADDQGRFTLLPRAALGFWGVVLVVIISLLPLLLSFLVQPKQPTESKKKNAAAIAAHQRNEWITIGVIVAVVIILLSVQLSTLAAFTATIRNTKNDARSLTYVTCQQAHASHSNPRPLLAYAMNSSSSIEVDISGNNRGGIWTPSSSGGRLSNYHACERDNPKHSANFSSTCLAYNTSITNPTQFSLEVWFRTNKKGTENGKLVGFGQYPDHRHGHNDRHIYLDKDGRVVFGIYPGRVATLASPAGKSYADDKWHHVVATLSSDGISLYLDGEQVGSNTSITSAQNYSGYWRFGCGGMNGWQHADGSRLNGAIYFSGQMQYGAVYEHVLTAAQVTEHYQAALK
ncbi:MAG: signal peptidase I [Candidatus Saccharibacteria bacterium]|nr:signal peptidase I [Candidatus Saccharibacteria bacterium]